MFARPINTARDHDFEKKKRVPASFYLSLYTLFFSESYFARNSIRKETRAIGQLEEKHSRFGGLAQKRKKREGRRGESGGSTSRHGGDEGKKKRAGAGFRREDVAGNTISRSRSRARGRLLFTAVRKACHNGIAGFLLKVRQYERDLWKKLSTKPSMAHPRLREMVYLAWECLQTFSP